MRADDPTGPCRDHTYLELYTVPATSAERLTHRILADQDAYDTWHLGYYVKEILSYRRLLAGGPIAFTDLPRKEKSLLLYLLLATRPGFTTVLELGSSLFEMIDGLSLVDRLYGRASAHRLDVDLAATRFLGVEPSELLAQTSVLLHPEQRPTVVPSLSAVTTPVDVLYDRAVSSYAFASAAELAAMLDRSAVALVNLFLSKGETFTSSILGKPLTYFSLEETVGLLQKPLFHLFGERVPRADGSEHPAGDRPVVEGFFLCCDDTLLRDVMTLAGDLPDVRRWFAEKGIAPKPARTLLG